jgi:5-methyltetrahydropteroyltriglutamate--homocysteine methyltransferase
VSGELQALAADGAAYLQLDEGFNSYVNPDWRQNLQSQGRDPDETLAQDIAADNACYDAVTAPGITRAMHLCRGSRVRWHFGSGDYNWLAERLFERLHVDRFLLEYDTAQAGGFEPLRFVAKGKIVVLGLVTVKSPQLERQDDLLRRIEEASRYCPIEQLALSTECGFQGAADRDGAHLTMDQQWRKLELVADTARKVWADANA